MNSYKISYTKMVGGVMQHFVRDIVAASASHALVQAGWQLAAFDPAGVEPWLFESCVRIERAAETQEEWAVPA